MTEDSNPEQSYKRERTRQVLSNLADKVASIPSGESMDTPAGTSSTGSPSILDARFLELLSGSSPTPAGGSASAYAGAMAAALIAKVAQITAGNPKYTTASDRMLVISQRSAELLRELSLAADQDHLAYQKYMSARRVAAVTPQEIAQKNAGLQNAREETIRLPLQVASICLDLLKLALDCVEFGSHSTICDSRAASLIAEAAMRACSNNILFNLKESPQEAYNASIRESLADLNRQGDNLLLLIQQQFFHRTQIP